MSFARPRPIHWLSFSFFLAAFLLPYLWLLPRVDLTSFRFSDIGNNYLYSFLQALFSSILTLALGLTGAWGLFWLEARVSPRRYGIFEFIVLMPALLPALFLVVPVLNLIPFFPFGFPGIVIMHALSEAGVAAIVCKKLFSQRLSAYADAASVMGSSASFFIRKTTSLLWVDVLQLSMVLFIYFLTSFSIPLLIGGTGFSSLEVALYEKIVVHHNWARAMNIFFFQFLCIGGLLLVFGLIRTPPSGGFEKKRLRILESFWGLIAISLPPLLIFLGLLSKLPRGFELLMYQPYVLENWDRYVAGSLLIGFITGGAVFLVLTIICYFLQIPKFRKFFFTFFTPSFVILGFTFYLLPGQHADWILTKIAWALTLAFVPVLLRFGLLQKITAIDAQLETATYLGADSFYLFKKITWPHCLPLISRLSGLGGVWAVGDFTLSRVIAGKDLNLAMWVQSLVDQYRWDIALVLSWMILFCGLTVFTFFGDSAMSQIKNLVKDFGDFKISIASWELPLSGLTLLWGPSGAGKTSVIRTLIGLEDCKTLEWHFNGVDVAHLPPHQRDISVVFQDLSLFPHLTARENILFPIEAQRKPVKDYKKDFDDVCALLGVMPFLDKKTQVLSGGEKQRVALARALITRPRMILLDEPFSSLDIQLKKQARELLKLIMRERQIPMVLVSHDPIDAEQLAQQVVILDKGEIKASQSPQDFLKSL